MRARHTPRFETARSSGICSMDAAQTISFRPHLAGQGAVSTALNTPSISLVLPALNEQEVIVQAIDEADEALAHHKRLRDSGR